MFHINRLARIFILAGCLALPAGTANAEVTHPTAQAFGQLPAISQPTLSPDGKYFATIQSLKGRPAALIYQIGAPVGTPTNPAVVQITDWLIDGLTWAKNDRLIISVKKSDVDSAYGTNTWSWAVAVDPDGSHLLKLKIGAVVNRLLDDPDMVLAYDVSFGLMGHYNGLRIDLVKYNVRTGKSDLVMHGGYGTYSFITDSKGNVIARLDQTEKPRQQHLFLYKDGRWDEALTVDVGFDKRIGVAGLADDSKALILFGRDEKGMQVLNRFDLETHKTTLLYAAPSGHDVDNPLFDEWTGRIVGASYTDDTEHHVYFDSAREALQLGLEKAFPGITVRKGSSNLSGEQIMLLAGSPKSPPAYYYLNRVTHQASLIAPTYPGLSPDELGEMKPYPYKARDGLDIPAYLTLPPGKTAKNLPVVIMPHGGPGARDEISFDWWSQFLANRGYAVLQPNFRGSEGYGKSFTDAGLHQWGLKMQDDITDGVKKLIADGIADPKRICIVGASYGGYAALAGATFTPDLYACAVSWAGISDLPVLMGTIITSTSKDAQIVKNEFIRIGSVFDDKDRLDATSPDRHADKVLCPILLMHGEGDSTVQIGQSELEEKALKKAGKTVEFIRFSGDEDHHMTFPATRIRVLTETERFLKKYIGD